MKVLHISHSDITGGAARAAYRLHRAQLSAGIDSSMLVHSKKSDDWTVIGPQGKFNRVLSLLRAPFASIIDRLQKSSNVNLHSGNWFPSNIVKKINISDAEVVNLHWINGEAISIEDIARINKPIVWTIHDMWPFCGAEHYTNDDETARWRQGYYKHNRSGSDKGIDIDRLVWQRKKSSWKKTIHIVSPSQWLADCASQSSLFCRFPISVVPNVLNTNIYQPLDNTFCRKVLGLPHDKLIVLFGAMGGGKDPRKGYDLLLEALFELSKKLPKNSIECVVFGQSEPEQAPGLPFKTHWLGHIHDDATLALLYNAATVMVVPSRQENLPQTVTEAQACGTPVVAFNCTGLTDVVEHQQTGYLAKPYDNQDMAAGLQWLLENPAECERLGLNARQRAEELWSKDSVVEQYRKIYVEAKKYS
ncbi:glycosyltransferase [Aeromonas caviae]|uniref:glycosyltransferase family 4 protein n=1 Tax=Aeromonas caviae TaxID=648 RepID=UPI000F5EE623|nr:glycosyltransferase family 4 protein [Aeromonas caviae]RQX17877.1 glycosyltransferase [Aeromonas caviae]